MTAQTSLIDEKPAVVLNTEYAREMLQKRYATSEWALLHEVAPATGGGTRYADAVAINLWRSRGHAIHGFEIKVSRSDWLRELKQPEKAEDVFCYCAHWWIVAPKGVVKDGELPPTWGLLELRASGLVQVVAAPRLTPHLITIEFFASLARRSNEQITQMAERMQRIAVNEARAQIDERVRKEVGSGLRRLRELEAEIAKFTEATGIEFTTYGAPPIEVVKLAEQLHSLSGWRGNGALSKLTELAADLECAAAKVRSAVEKTELRVSA